MKRVFFPLVGSLLALATTSHAFLPNPDLLTVSPSVAKAGATVEVTINGKNLDEAGALRFSDARIVGKQKTLPADDLHPQPRPVENTFTVTIPADVESGVYEVRSRGYFGLSTARPFLVVPAESNELVKEGDISTPETAMELPLDTGVIGTLPTGKFDHYRFEAKKGQRLLLEVRAERIDSQADVILAVIDAQGRELENSRHHFGRDPFVDFTAPADGTYYATLTDSLYKGGRDYFYHLRLGDGPHVDFVFPPAGEPGKPRTFTFFGRNLPEGSPGGDWKLDGKPLETVDRRIDVPAEPGVPASFDSGIPRQAMLPGFAAGVDNSNPVKIGFATAPVVLEQAAAKEQDIAVPAEVAGRFDEPGDYDSYRFAAKKGATYWVEAVSHRLGVTADPVLVVEKVVPDKDGKETFQPVAENDDLPSFYGRDQLDDLNADSLDPALSFTPDEDATYRVTLVNQSAGGSPAHVYRLAIREAQHDFQLISGTELTKTINNDAYPVAPLLRQGGSMIFRIMAFRQDGFEGDITVTVNGLPEGVTAKPLVLSGDTRQGMLTLWANPETKPWTGAVEIVGTAKIGEKDVRRVARNASILWGTRVFGNASQVRSRLDMETVLSVIETETEPTRMSLAEEKTWEVPVKGTLELPLRLAENGVRTGNLQVEVHGFPGLYRSPPKISVAEKDTEAVLKIPFTPSSNFAVKPGRYQFVLRGVGNMKYSRNPAAAERAEAEVKRLDEIGKKVPGEVEAAKKELAAAEQAHAAARKKAEGAADDAARKAAEPEVAAAQKRVDDSKKAVAAAEAKSESLRKLVDAAKKKAAAATAAAKEASSPFATFSQPITVVVTEEK